MTHNTNKALAELDKVTGGHTHERHSATKSDKWLKARALGAEPQPVGPAATKFVTPTVHLKTIKLLERKVARAIRARLDGKPIPKNCNIPKLKKLTPPVKITTTRQPMRHVVGRGYYSKTGAAEFGVNPGDPTGPLTHATATFWYKGLDTSGAPILEQVTAYPALP